MTPLNEAILAAGSQRKLAGAIGVSQGLISYWVNRRKGKGSAEMAIKIENITGIARARLRPDLFS